MVTYTTSGDQRALPQIKLVVICSKHLQHPAVSGCLGVPFSQIARTCDYKEEKMPLSTQYGQAIDS